MDKLSNRVESSFVKPILSEWSNWENKSNSLNLIHPYSSDLCLLIAHKNFVLNQKRTDVSLIYWLSEIEYFCEVQMPLFSIYI